MESRGPAVDSLRTSRGDLRLSELKNLYAATQQQQAEVFSSLAMFSPPSSSKHSRGLNTLSPAVAPKQPGDYWASATVAYQRPKPTGVLFYQPTTAATDGSTPQNERFDAVGPLSTPTSPSMMCSGGCTDTSVSAADTASPSPFYGGLGGLNLESNIEEEAQSVILVATKEVAPLPAHALHPPIEEEPIVLQQRSPTPPPVLLATETVTAVESPAESSSFGPALEPMRLAFDTVEAPVRHRSVVVAQNKVDNKVENIPIDIINVHQGSIRSSEGVSKMSESSANEAVLPQQQLLPKVSSTAALLRLKRTVVQRQAVQLASSLSTQSENSSLPQKSSSIGMVRGSAETMNTPAPPRPVPVPTSAAEPVQETVAAASTASRPYLKRRSQAIPIQPPPDWSSVKPRTQSKLDRNLILRNGKSEAGASTLRPLDKAAAAAAGGSQIGRSRATTAPSQRHETNHSNAKPSREQSTRPYAYSSAGQGPMGTAQRAAARKPWGSVRPSPPPKTSATGHRYTATTTAPYNQPMYGNNLYNDKERERMGPLGSAFMANNQYSIDTGGCDSYDDPLGHLVQHVDTLLCSVGRAIRK